MSVLTGVSLFAGIGGIDRALQRAGISVVAAVEIDADCRKILARHFPGTAIFDDVTQVTGDQLLAAGFVPHRGILAAGWPCQGNSVAGRRKGMDDARSSLWRHVVRLLAETRPAWFLGENVPGLLSVNSGRDFAACCDDLARVGMGFAWRVLDAQHFGVPQRRRRVFIVGRAGDWRCTGPVQVLFEPESGDGDPAEGRSAGPGTAAASDGGTVGTLATTSGGWRVGADEAAAGQLVAHALNTSQQRLDGTVETLIAWDAAQITHPENRVNPQPGDPAPPLAATGSSRIHIAPVPLAVRGRDGGTQLEAGQPGDPMWTLRAGDGGSSRSPLIAHALTAEGADASEDGTGRGTPLIVAPIQDGRALAKEQNGLGVGADGDPAYTIDTTGAGAVVAFAWQAGGKNDASGAVNDDGTTPTLPRSQTLAVQAPGTAVRRLTPLECERLQGFPDGWTAGQSDSTRYRQLGNAVAVPCAEWITRRIAATHHLAGERAS